MSDLEVPLSSCNFTSCGTERSPYGYRPSAPASAIFMVMFLSALIGILSYAIPGRKWLAFSIPISVACVFEIIGFGLRLGAYLHPWDMEFFAESTTLLTIAPAFISTGIYSLIPKTIDIVGAEHAVVNLGGVRYSLIDSRRFPWLVYVDSAGLAFQLIGAVVAFSDLPTSSITGFGPEAGKGSAIMAAGTSLQALSLTYLLMLFAVVGNRASREHRNFGYTTFHHQYGFVAMTQKFKIIVVMTVVACVCLFARAIFQTVFLGCGFESRNPVENVEALYLVFNGFFVAEPVIGLVIAHPSSFLQDGLKQRKRNRLPSSSGLFDNSTESAWNSCQSLRTPSFVPSRPARSTVGSFWEVQSRSSSPHTRGTSNHWIMQSPIRSPQPSRLRYEEAAPPWDDAADFL